MVLELASSMRRRGIVGQRHRGSGGDLFFFGHLLASLLVARVLAATLQLWDEKRRRIGLSEAVVHGRNVHIHSNSRLQPRFYRLSRSELPRPEFKHNVDHVIFRQRGQGHKPVSIKAPGELPDSTNFNLV